MPPLVLVVDPGFLAAIIVVWMFKVDEAGQHQMLDRADSVKGMGNERTKDTWDFLESGGVEEPGIGGISVDVVAAAST